MLAAIVLIFTMLLLGGTAALDSAAGFQQARFSKQAPTATWSYTYGGGNYDSSFSVVECSGGGFAMAGGFYNMATTDDVWLIRTDANGIHQWNKTFGDTGIDQGTSIVECSGGGFAIAGYTNSFGEGNYDVWLIRTDPTGNHLWNVTFGGSNSDGGSGDAGPKLVECSDGGFAIVATTESFGAGLHDVWLIRTDASGTHQWNETYGGTSADWGAALIEYSTGGFVIAGYTQSYGAGNYDGWILRTDASGTHQWNFTWGDVNENACEDLVECSDGGLAATGYTMLFGGGGYNVALVRSDSSGNILWTRTYGTPETDKGYSVIECSGGGFAIAGHTYTGATSFDGLLIRTYSNGTEYWTQTYDGTASYMDMVWQIIQCASGSDLILTGYQGFGGGNNDAWLLRTQDNAPPAPTTPPTTPPTNSTPPPPIPGFPAAAIAVGTGIALGLGIISRRRDQEEPPKH
jgi:hypothetical protein